jgi:hypothetical protein
MLLSVGLGGAIIGRQGVNREIESDRYPFSPRIRTLRAILTKLRPEPV